MKNTADSGIVITPHYYGAMRLELVASRPVAKMFSSNLGKAFGYYLLFVEKQDTIKAISS